jgi:hypothetical protein
MFVGAVPKQVCQQLVSSIDFQDWGACHIGCSGSFRVEQALTLRHPGLPLHSNDVSLLSCAIGAMLTGQKFKAGFTGELDFLQPLVSDDPASVLAAVGVALDYSTFRESNRFGRVNRASIRQNCETLFKANLEKNAFLTGGVKIDGFLPGDFRLQLDRAIEAGGGFFSFAPTYKAGYERLYKLINDNVVWDAPKYDIWDPRDTPRLIEKCLDHNTPFCILTDNRLDGFKPKIFFKNFNKPIFAYSGDRSSLRRISKKIAPFRFTPIEPDLITKDSKVEIKIIPNKNMNYLKTVFLSKNIDFTLSPINFILLVDSKLAGGFSYKLNKFNQNKDAIYLLSDFAINGARKMAKLIALTATSKTVIDILKRKFFNDIKFILTTAFSDKPVSMKYRGIFDLTDRKDGHLNYQSKVRDLTPPQIFDLWWKKYGSKS